MKRIHIKNIKIVWKKFYYMAQADTVIL
jgi:hypothetical protein